MSFLPFPATTTSEAVALIKQDGGILHEIVHGGDTAEVLTEGGLVPSVNNVIKTVKDRVLSAGGTVYVQNFIGNGSQVNFVLSNQVLNENIVQVYFNGVYQSKNTYSIATDKITLVFSTPPSTGVAIEVVTFSVLPLGFIDDSQVNMYFGGTLRDLGTIPFTAASVKSLIELPLVNNAIYTVHSFYPNVGFGGGTFQWKADKAKSTHTGGTILDPLRIAAWSGDFSDLSTLYTAGTAGVGCFVKIDENLTVDSFGAVPEGQGLLDVVLTKMESVGIREIVANNRTYKTDNFIPNSHSLSFAGNAFIKIKSGHIFNIKGCESNKSGTGEPIRMVYTDVDWDWGTCAYLKSLGFNTIMTFGLFDQANQFLLLRSVIAAKMQIMAYSNLPTASLPQLIDQYPNVIAYYIYDEPDASLTPLATQDARINSYKAVTTKPIACSIAVQSEMQQLVSENFDLAFVQHYYTEGVTATVYGTGSLDRDNISKALHLQGSYQHKLPKTKLIPIVGLFTNSNFTNNKSKIVGFARDVARLSEDGSLAVFAWGGATDPNNTFSPKNDADLLKFLTFTCSFNNCESRIVVTPLVFASDNDYIGFSDLSSYPMLTSNSTPSVKDVKLFSVKNIGSVVNEYESNFHEQGIAASNSGGYVLINVGNAADGCCSGLFNFRNKVDTTTATVGLSVTQNGGYTVTDIFSEVLNNNSGKYLFMSPNFVPSGIKSYSMLVRFQPTSSNPNHWKFLVGQFYMSNWPDVTY